MMRGAIFDIDGTILNSSTAWSTAPARYLAQFGITVPADVIQNMNALTFEEGILFLKKKYDLKDTPEVIAGDLKHQISEMYLNEVPEKPWARKFLKYFFQENIPVVLATAGSFNMSSLALRRLKLDRCAVACLCCDQMRTSKREPKIYREAASLIKADPSEIWVFEDNLTALLTAKNAGFVTVGVSDISNRASWEKIRKTVDYTIDGDTEDYHLLELIQQKFR